MSQRKISDVFLPKITPVSDDNNTRPSTESDITVSSLPVKSPDADPQSSNQKSKRIDVCEVDKTSDEAKYRLLKTREEYKEYDLRFIYCDLGVIFAHSIQFFNVWTFFFAILISANQSACLLRGYFIMAVYATNCHENA